VPGREASDPQLGARRGDPQPQPIRASE
jgi:hypothetical protein